MRIENKFIVCNTKYSKAYINVKYVSCFLYNRETDRTEICVHGLDSSFVFNGDVTDDIVKKIYSVKEE